MENSLVDCIKNSRDELSVRVGEVGLREDIGMEIISEMSPLPVPLPLPVSIPLPLPFSRSELTLDAVVLRLSRLGSDIKDQGREPLCIDHEIAVKFDFANTTSDPRIVSRD